MEYPKDEKRGRERVAHHYILRARQITPTTHPDDWELSTVRNISKVGILFYSSHRYEAGAELEIRIKNPLFPKESTCWGSVIRCVPLKKMDNTYGVAVEIKRIEEETRQALNETIEFFIQKEKKQEKEPS